jgi:nucleoid-associated protein YgaU
VSNITRTSRYFEGPLAQIPNKTTGEYDIAVYREFASIGSVTFRTHTWVYGDNLSSLANKYLSNPLLWWQIMEINPEITDPFSIEPGAEIRVPYVSR